MNNYEIKKERRIERLKRAMELTKKMSESIYERARTDASAIPFGQPILVGHHSEKRDRNYRNRIHRRFEKAFELQEKAEYYERRLSSAISNRAISSDDPEAIFKIEEKVLGLEKLQEKMKAVNKIIRKFDLTTQKQECIQAIVTAGLLKEDNAVKIVEPDFCGRVGFASYQTTNNNANISRLKKRIEELKQKQSMETSKQIFGDVEVVKNVEENRLQFFFKGKPSEEIRSKLKSYGFRWSPYNGCWQAFLNNRAEYLIHSFFGNNRVSI